MAFQMPPLQTAPAAAPAAAPAPVAAAAVGTVAPVSSSSSSSVSSSYEEFGLLLSAVQDGWTRSVAVDTLRRTVMQFSDNLATVQEQGPSAVARAAIESKNVEMDGMKLNLSDDRTVSYILDVSSTLHLNELDSLRLVYQSAQSLSRSSPEFARGSGAEVQAAIKTRAVEIFYRRRFNLLTSLLDLVLMDRATGGAVGGAASSAGLAEEDPLTRVVGEAVSELLRLGVARNVMVAIEAAYHYPKSTPAVAAYRASELSYLLRILFALFRGGDADAVGSARDVASEDLLRLVELLQTRSTALATETQQARDAQARAAASQLQLDPSAASSTDAATFNCYALLCTFLAALDAKYRNLVDALAARDDQTASSDRATVASQANADADLAQLLATLQRKITAPDNWKHDVLRCGALLAWSLFLRRVRAIAPGTDITEEEVQGLVLEGLGGSDESGFFIHLAEQMRSNTAFAPMVKDASGDATCGRIDAAVNGALVANAAGSLVSATPSSSALCEELSVALGEFLFQCLSVHGKEMDLLRREDNKTDHAYQKQVARHQKLMQAQQQQQHLYHQHAYGYGQQAFGGGAAAAAAALPELPPAPKLNFSAFLSLLGTVAAATPALVPLLWSSPEFESFLGAELQDPQSLPVSSPLRGGDHHHHATASASIFTSESPFLLGYIDLLAALCVDESSSVRVYEFVRGCSRVSWEMIITNFLQQNLIASYLPAAAAAAHQQAIAADQRGRGYGNAANPNYRSSVPPPPPPPLAPRQLDLLSSLLGLLSAVVRPSASLQALFATRHPEWKLLDTMFALLGLPGLGVHIKARVVRCITSMARLNATQATMAWERLERSQVLPTVQYANQLVSASRAHSLAGGVAAAPLEGLLFDLEEIENTMQTYPLTGAFLDLILTLLESAPVPRQLGVGVRNPSAATAAGNFDSHRDGVVAATSGLYGITPYLSFVASRVFLNLPHRLYATHMEQFALSETSLAIFTATIREWIADMQAGAAAGVRVQEAASGSFHARHMSHQFANPNGTFAPPPAEFANEADAEKARLLSLASHPAHALLRDLLAAKELLQQVLITMTVSHALLEGTPVAGETRGAAAHASVEGALLASLRLLWTVLEQEDAIVDTLHRIDSVTTGAPSIGGFRSGVHGRYLALSTLLMQHQPSVLTIAKSTGYIQTHAATAVQQLIADRTSRETTERRTKTQNGDQTTNVTNAINQSMYDGEADDDAMITDAAAAAATAADAVADDTRTTEVAFYASSSLLLLSVRDDSRLVHVLEANQATSAVLAAFQRQLRNVQLPTEAPGEIRDPDLHCNRARLVLLDLLLSSLHSPHTSTPHVSLALLLLGFDIATPAAVQQTDLMRSPRRDLFDALFFDFAVKPGVAHHFPTLSQAVYQLLYKLASHPLTSAPTMRCLKSHPASEGSVAAYLTRLLHALPIVSDVTFLTRLLRTDVDGAKSPLPGVISTSGASHQVYQSLAQLSWVLRIVNLHYFLSARDSARTRTIDSLTDEWVVDEEVDRYLVELGFVEADEEPIADSTDANTNDWLNAVASSSFLSMQGQATAPAASRSGVKLLNVLSHLHTYLRAVLPASYQLESPPGVLASGVDLAQLKYFDPQHNAVQYALSDVYVASLRSGLSAKDAYSETRKCLEWNIVTGVLGCAKQAFEAWKQCVEVVLTQSSALLTRKNATRFESILLQLLQTLLQKLVSPDDNVTNGSAPNATASSLSIWIALGEELSSLSLTVIAKLREVLQFSAAAPHLDSSFGVGSSLARSADLHAILALLVSAILATRHSATRVHLYAIFLHYILYNKDRNDAIERGMAPTADDEEDGAAPQQARWIAVQQEQLRLDSQNLALLSSHNLPLLTLVVNDALDGSAQLRGVSFRFLNVMLLGSSAHASFQIASRAADKAPSSLGPSRFFSGRGAAASSAAVLPATFTTSCLSVFQKNNLLLLFLNQIKANDDALQSAIYATGPHAPHQVDLLRNLECCLSFFLQLAMTAEGATMMVEYQLVRVLASLGFLASRPAPSSRAAGEYENGVGAGATGVPSPFEKHQSIYLLVVQLLARLLQSLPRHSALVSQVHRFLEVPAHHEAIAAVVKDSLAQVTPLQLRLLSAALALIHQMVKEERDASGDAPRDDQQRKVQKVGAGARGLRQTGVQSYEIVPPTAAQQQQAPTGFTSFVQKYQPFLLLLLARYAQPQSSPRLRSYLSAHIRALQAHSAGRMDPALDLLLERGDETMQTILRKVLALLVVQVAPSADGDVSQVALFGPRLGDGADVDVADLFGEDGVDTHNPPTPHLELLVAILADSHARLQTAHRQLFALRKSLEQLSQSSAAPLASTLYPDLNATSNTGNLASNIAALELEYFPPSAASAFFYQELDAVQRVKLLRQRLQQHLRMHQQQTEKYTWSIEHALMLLHHHVRVYLPSSPSHRHTVSAAGLPSLSPGEFRQHAERALLPLLASVSQTVCATAASPKSPSPSDQQLALYQPQNGVHDYQPRLAAATNATSASFIDAMISRINKIILG